MEKSNAIILSRKAKKKLAKQQTMSSEGESSSQIDARIPLYARCNRAHLHRATEQFREAYQSGTKFDFSQTSFYQCEIEEEQNIQKNEVFAEFEITCPLQSDTWPALSPIRVKTIKSESPASPESILPDIKEEAEPIPANLLEESRRMRKALAMNKLLAQQSRCESEKVVISSPESLLPTVEKVEPSTSKASRKVTFEEKEKPKEIGDLLERVADIKGSLVNQLNDSEKRIRTYIESMFTEFELKLLNIIEINLTMSRTIDAISNKITMLNQSFETTKSLDTTTFNAKVEELEKIIRGISLTLPVPTQNVGSSEQSRRPATKRSSPERTSSPKRRDRDNPADNSSFEMPSSLDSSNASTSANVTHSRTVYREFNLGRYISHARFYTPAELNDFANNPTIRVHDYVRIKKEEMLWFEFQYPLMPRCGIVSLEDGKNVQIIFDAGSPKNLASPSALTQIQYQNSRPYTLTTTSGITSTVVHYAPIQWIQNHTPTFTRFGEVTLFFHGNRDLNVEVEVVDQWIMREPVLILGRDFILQFVVRNERCKGEITIARQAQEYLTNPQRRPFIKTVRIPTMKMSAPPIYFHAVDQQLIPERIVPIDEEAQ